VLESRFKEAAARMVEAERRVKAEIMNGSKFADENELLRKRCVACCLTTGLLGIGLGYV
jgi:hypothetical protein